MKRTRDGNVSRGSYRAGMEENTLAILDPNELHNDSREANDDRLDFLQVVRATSLVPKNGSPPTAKIFEAVLRILRSGQSLELIMASYHLLNDLNQRFPLVHAKKTPGRASHELVVANELSPFVLGSDVASTGRDTGNASSSVLFCPMGFNELVQKLTKVACEANNKTLDTKVLGKMLLFHYIVSILEGDFVPRNDAYKDTENWSVLRDSLLNMLLSSRRVNYKAFVKDCLTITCGLCQVHNASNNSIGISGPAKDSYRNSDNASAIASLEVRKMTCMATQKLITIIMELDMSRQQAGLDCHTTRADGVRTAIADVILEELAYDKTLMFSFLQVFNDTKWKLEIITQYFMKYNPKASVRTRRSSNNTGDLAGSGVLKYFSNDSSMQSIIKKLDVDVVQFLLVHAFQAYLSMSSQTELEDTSKGNSEGKSLSVAERCEDLMAAYNSLRNLVENVEISQLGKESLFTAATLLSTTS